MYFDGHCSYLEDEIMNLVKVPHPTCLYMHKYFQMTHAVNIYAHEYPPTLDVPFKCFWHHKFCGPAMKLPRLDICTVKSILKPRKTWGNHALKNPTGLYVFCLFSPLEHASSMVKYLLKVLRYVSLCSSDIQFCNVVCVFIMCQQPDSNLLYPGLLYTTLHFAEHVVLKPSVLVKQHFLPLSSEPHSCWTTWKWYGL